VLTWRRGLGASVDYSSQVSSLAPSYGIPPSLALAVMQAESSGNPAAVSPAGAIGLFQLMPATAQSLGVNPNDPTQNIQGGLTYQRRAGRTRGAWGLPVICSLRGRDSLRGGASRFHRLRFSHSGRFYRLLGWVGGVGPFFVVGLVLGDGCRFGGRFNRHWDGVQTIATRLSRFRAKK